MIVDLAAETAFSSCQWPVRCYDGFIVHDNNFGKSTMVTAYRFQEAPAPPAQAGLLSWIQLGRDSSHAHSIGFRDSRASGRGS